MQKKCRVNIGGLEDVVINGSQIIYIASPIANNDDFFLQKFINMFLYLPASPRPNISTHFELIDT